MYACMRAADCVRLGFAGEIGKLLGARWKELDDEEKKVRRVPRLTPRIALTPPPRARIHTALPRPGRKGQGARREGEEGLRRQSLSCACSDINLTQLSYCFRFRFRQKKKGAESASGDGEEDDDD